MYLQFIHHQYFYYIKALFFIDNQNFSELKKFIHYSYHPHLGSFFWAFFSNLMPIKLEYFGRLFYVFIFCFSMFYVCHNNLKEKFTGNIIFILIIAILYIYERFSGLQEILIFSFLVILSKYFFLIKESKNTWHIFFVMLNLLYEFQPITFRILCVAYSVFATFRQVPKNWWCHELNVM